MTIIGANGRMHHKANDLITRAEAEAMAVKIVEHYMAQVPGLVRQVLHAIAAEPALEAGNQVISNSADTITPVTETLQ